MGDKCVLTLFPIALFVSQKSSFFCTEEKSNTEIFDKSQFYMGQKLCVLNKNPKTYLSYKFKDFKFLREGGVRNANYKRR